MEKLLRQHGEPRPEIECISIVGKDLSDWEPEGGREASASMLKSQNMRLLQYDALIENAYKAYQAYLEATKKVSEIQKTLDQIDEDLTPSGFNVE